MAVHPRKWLSFLLLGVLSSSIFLNVATAASTPKKTSTASKNKKKSAAARRNSPRVRRMRQAFVASASLKPMARQLLQDRSAAAYAGVEAYARKHAKEDAGALAWLVVGYAHILDHDYAKAVDPLNRAKPKAGDLGDYVDYYLASSYFSDRTQRGSGGDSF